MKLIDVILTTTMSIVNIESNTLWSNQIDGQVYRVWAIARDHRGTTLFVAYTLESLEIPKPFKPTWVRHDQTPTIGRITEDFEETEYGRVYLMTWVNWYLSDDTPYIWATTLDYWINKFQILPDFSGTKTL